MRIGDTATANKQRQRGFTYIGMLALLALIGYFLAAGGMVVATTMKREREAQLLFIGHEYRHAIASYYRRMGHYPQTLEELVQSDAVGALPAHYLRRLYPDPMTGTTDWLLLPAPGSGIMGVASSSRKTPLKQAGFDDEDQNFEKADSYSQWGFLYDPRAELLRYQSAQSGTVSAP